MNRKAVSILLAAGMTVMAMTGCGSSQQAPAKTEVAAVTDTESKEETKAEAPAEAKLVDIGAEYSVSTEYDEYALVDYHYDETDEDVTWVVSRKADGSAYDVHFTFFGDEQVCDFTVDGDTPTVTFDKSGFITKDIDKMWEVLKAVNDWTAIEK